ncbi:hypothetical protein HDU88_003438 [Geranomyces variabilis]|nr:hypothetical protein HDU88_003438 [Geranomyces variabilis]
MSAVRRKGKISRYSRELSSRLRNQKEKSPEATHSIFRRKTAAESGNQIARSANDRRNLQHVLRIAARILGTKRNGAEVHVSALDRDRNM